MRSGKLSKQEIRALQRACNIADELAEWKRDNGEDDDTLIYADSVSNAIMWLLAEVRTSV